MATTQSERPRISRRAGHLVLGVDVAGEGADESQDRGDVVGRGGADPGGQVGQVHGSTIGRSGDGGLEWSHA